MKIKDGRETITTKIAYIAGFFDGEGCIRLKHANQGGNSYYVWVAITNSNRLILDEVVELFGGNVRKAEKTVNKIVYHYLITASEAVDFLKTIIQFLKEKKEQAELAIAFHETKALLTPEAKANYAAIMSRMKRGNIYENPELNLILTNEMQES